MSLKFTLVKKVSVAAHSRHVLLSSPRPLYVIVMEEMRRRGVPTWQEELASLMDGGLQYDDGSPIGQDSRSVDGSGSGSEPVESLKDQVAGFMKSWGEMLMDLAVGCKDVAQQTLVSEDSVVVRKLRRPAAKLRFLNEYLPEDRDPAHAWPVILFVFLIALAGIVIGLVTSGYFKAVFLQCHFKAVFLQ